MEEPRHHATVRLESGALDVLLTVMCRVVEMDVTHLLEYALTVGLDCMERAVQAHVLEGLEGVHALGTECVMMECLVVGRVSAKLGSLDLIALEVALLTLRELFAEELGTVVMELVEMEDVIVLMDGVGMHVKCDHALMDVCTGFVEALESASASRDGMGLLAMPPLAAQLVWTMSSAPEAGCVFLNLIVALSMGTALETRFVLKARVDAVLDRIRTMLAVRWLARGLLSIVVGLLT